MITSIQSTCRCVSTVCRFWVHYGESTKSSLSRSHSGRFLLRQADYDRLQPLLTNALWPYSAPHPDKAEDEYSEAVGKLALGQFKLMVIGFEADPNSGSIHNIKFQVEITVPAGFELDSNQSAHSAPCLVIE